MSFSKKITTKLAIFLFVLFFVCWPGSVLAAMISTEDTIAIGPTEIIDDDVYLFGDTVAISGLVLGDAIVFSREAVIDGTIKGSLLIIAQTVRINGNIEGTIRGGANTIYYQGSTGRDLMLGANTMSIGGTVGQDFFGAASNIVLNGLIGRDIKGSANRLVIDGSVGGDINVYASDLVIAPGAIISGNITYRSDKEATVDRQAVISGFLKRLDPPSEAATVSPGRSAWDFIRPILSLLVLTLLMVLLFPVFTAGTARTIREKPALSVGYGALIVFVAPVAALLLLVTVIGVPVSLLSMLLYVVLISLARVFAGYFLAYLALERIGKSMHPIWTGLLGVLVLALLIRIPYIGWLIHLVAVLFAAGAVILYLIDSSNPTARSE